MIANDMIAPIIVLYSNLSDLEIDGVNDTLNKSNLLKQLKIEFMISIYRIFLYILLIFIKNHKLMVLKGTYIKRFIWWIKFLFIYY